MVYINSGSTNFNGATGSMGRYSFMGKHDAALYGPLYHNIDMGSPEMDDMPSQAAPGASMATQARAAGYQDIFRNIQAMREAEFKKEVKGKQITSEFSGLRPGGLGGGFWFS